MDSPVEWWRTFFSGAAVESWLKAPTDEQTAQEVAFNREELGVEPPASLLDVPCGGGRHSLALARLGYNMTGVDLSSDFLAAARSQPSPGTGSVAWEQREMRDLPWSERFDGAFCFGNSFGYLDDRGNADFLKDVTRTLKPGARFVLETGYVLELLLPNLQARTWYPMGDMLMLADRRYDHIDGRLYVEYTWISAGKVEKRAMSARLYTYREIFGLLEAAGFKDLKAYGSLTREPFRMGCGRLIASATKSEGF